LKKKKLKEEALVRLKSEIDIMAKLDHPSIVKLYEAYDTKKLTVLILELITGGELFDALVNREGPYYEGDAKDIVLNIVRGVRYMHSMGICHRDLKPENILLINSNDAKNIKITDFGLSKDFSRETLITSVGTASYAAPEVLLGRPYTPGCDVWSIGVIAFILLSAEFPFYGPDEPTVFRAILSMKYKFREDIWGDNKVSEEAKDFISKIFVGATKRLTAEQCLQHPWLMEKVKITKELSWSQGRNRSNLELLKRVKKES